MADGRFDIFTERLYKRSLTEFSRLLVRIIDARGEKEREQNGRKNTQKSSYSHSFFSALLYVASERLWRTDDNISLRSTEIK